MSTHYTAGGMPLAFTQEDFLVYNEFGYNELRTASKIYLQREILVIDINVCTIQLQ